MHKQILFLSAGICLALNVPTLSASLGGLIDDALGVASKAVGTAADITTDTLDTVRDEVHNHHHPAGEEITTEHHYYPHGEKIIQRSVKRDEGPGHSVVAESTVTTETYVD